jgi:hypothetical protein
MSDHIGPLTAESIDEAAESVLACVALNPDRSWIIDVPGEVDPAWQAWLRSKGFTPQRTFTRMYRSQILRGPAQAIPANLYATSGPEFPDLT